MVVDKLQKGAWIGSLCLVILVFQHTLFFYATHEGRVPDKDGNMYFAPTMVVYVELFKAMISFAILYYQQYRKHARNQDSGSYALLSGDMSESQSGNAIENAIEKSFEDNETSSNLHLATWNSVSELIFSKSAWKLAVPATLYVIQTITAVYGAQNLSTTSFVIASQLKLATTALCTSVMLNRVIGAKRWFSIATLTFGVLLVQLQGQTPVHNKVNDARDPVLGLLAIILACFISGFAAIFVEKILKNGVSNVWATNIQLGSFGIIPAVIPVIGDALRNGLHHPFLNFEFWAWTTVFANVLGGLVVALIMKYADNIQKSMAISVSIVLTFLITVAVGKADMRPLAMVGATFVCGSIVAYARWAPPSSPTLVSEPTSPQSTKEAELTQVTIQMPPPK